LWGVGRLINQTIFWRFPLLLLFALGGDAQKTRAQNSRASANDDKWAKKRANLGSELNAPNAHKAKVLHAATYCPKSAFDQLALGRPQNC
jgi:hypothetical protein